MNHTIGGLLFMVVSIRFPDTLFYTYIVWGNNNISSTLLTICCQYMNRVKIAGKCAQGNQPLKNLLLLKVGMTHSQ